MHTHFRPTQTQKAGAGPALKLLLLCIKIIVIFLCAEKNKKKVAADITTTRRKDIDWATTKIKMTTVVVLGLCQCVSRWKEITRDVNGYSERRERETDVKNNRRKIDNNKERQKRREQQKILYRYGLKCGWLSFLVLTIQRCNMTTKMTIVVIIHSLFWFSSVQSHWNMHTFREKRVCETGTHTSQREEEYTKTTRKTRQFHPSTDWWSKNKNTGISREAKKTACRSSAKQDFSCLCESERTSVLFSVYFFIIIKKMQ